FDHVFTALRSQDDTATATIRDPASGRSLKVTFDDTYRECVLYTPGHREAFCIEPYTCVPDAYRLQAAGCDTGLRVLPPGGTFSAEMTVSVV
ncbi:MAG: hypothetical protein K8T25_17355, partial [Planctomycetia bacterium]|nr:hypothetical protein [Planctomycetia bacterium]